MPQHTMYLTWQPSLLEQCLCDLNLAAETKGIATGKHRHDMAYDTCSSKTGVSWRKKLRSAYELTLVKKELFQDAKNLKMAWPKKKTYYFIIKSGNISHMKNFYRMPSFRKVN